MEIKLYKGIIKVNRNLEFNPELLVQEFIEKLSEKIKVIYGPVENWKGICVKDGQGVNLLEQLPELQKLIAQIGENNVTGVFYYNLHKGSVQHIHRDLYGNGIFGCARMHIAVKTNADAFLEVDHVKYHFGIGEIWSFDTSKIHRAINNGNEDRIHIVIDVKKNSHTLDLFPQRGFSFYPHIVAFFLYAVKKVFINLFKSDNTFLKNIKDTISIFKPKK